MTLSPSIASMLNFLFSSPLYSTHHLDDEALRTLIAGSSDPIKYDGYCPSCKKDTTYNFHQVGYIGKLSFTDLPLRWSYDFVSMSCGREKNHMVRIYTKLASGNITKIGQYPSLADIAISETKQKYRSVLRGENWNELYKAIGLAAHGEGIGSFLYLRRVFERLIQSRFAEFKDAEGWSEDDFKTGRMEDKINLLKGHLPDFLVENRRIYGIFSRGVHELENEECLAFFAIGKESILVILEEDLQKKEALAMKDRFRSAIAHFGDSDPKQQA